MLLAHFTMAPLSGGSKWTFGPWCWCVGSKKKKKKKPLTGAKTWVGRVGCFMSAVFSTHEKGPQVNLQQGRGRAGVRFCVWGAKASPSCPIPQKSSCNCHTNQREKKKCLDRLSAAWWLKCCIAAELMQLHYSDITSVGQCTYSVMVDPRAPASVWGSAEPSFFCCHWSQGCDDIEIYIVFCIPTEGFSKCAWKNTETLLWSH